MNATARTPRLLLAATRAATVIAAVTAVVMAAAPAGPAFAQEKVMQEKDVTEKALIDALRPPAAASAAAGDDAIRTRSFRPAVRPAAVAGTTAAAAAGAVAAQPSGRASILVTFVTNSAELTERAKSALDVLAGAMKSERLASVRFTIEGHADPRGGDELNMRLSQARADAVREYLVYTHKLPGERVAAVGKGSSALLNTQDVTAAENRRVTIVSSAQ